MLDDPQPNILATVMSENLKENWNSTLASFSGAHILQTQEWGDIKSQFGWSPHQEVWQSAPGEVYACAQVLTRQVTISRIKFPLRVMYVPKGPILRDWHDRDQRNQVLNKLKTLARQQSAIFIKIDPEVEWGRGENEGEVNADAGEVSAVLTASGWISSHEQVQFRNTMVIDLSLEPDQLMSRMKQKTRYNVRLAARRGVSIRKGELSDLEPLYKMYAETSLRDGFAIRHREYYLTVWRTFIDRGLAEPLIAEVNGDAVAGLIVFRFAGRAWYMYGMSTAMHREKMPNYLLQWKAMLSAKEAGCRVYDLWGAPDKFEQDDSLWGVYRFKQGLGAEVVRYIGAWDLPLNHSLYRFYTQLMPFILSQFRRKGVQQTQGSIAPG